MSHPLQSTPDQAVHTRQGPMPNEQYTTIEKGALSRTSSSSGAITSRVWEKEGDVHLTYSTVDASDSSSMKGQYL